MKKENHKIKCNQNKAAMKLEPQNLLGVLSSCLYRSKSINSNAHFVISYMKGLANLADISRKSIKRLLGKVSDAPPYLKSEKSIELSRKRSNPVALFNLKIVLDHPTKSDFEK